MIAELADARPAAAPAATDRGLHVAIIMDGNGRWAQDRGQPRTAGHEAGADAVRRTVEAAPDCGIAVLTLFAFSADNWRRPPAEVEALMRLLGRYLERETDRAAREGLRLSVIGRRDRLRPALRRAVERAEAATAAAPADVRLHLRVAVDYSARDAIVRAAAARGPRRPPSRAAFARLLGEACHAGEPAPDVDLLIRTGGEQRLSDFLLWECAYAELVFLERRWPDFDAADLGAAVGEFRRRERRFGRVPA
jgi:undecaprenyl diphosphate synthase